MLHHWSFVLIEANLDKWIKTNIKWKKLYQHNIVVLQRKHFQQNNQNSFPYLSSLICSCEYTSIMNICIPIHYYALRNFIGHTISCPTLEFSIESLNIRSHKTTSKKIMNAITKWLTKHSREIKSYLEL